VILSRKKKAISHRARYIPETRHQPSSQGPAGWVNTNLRTVMTRIVKRAGLQPWPRLFHALRASAETDLAAEYPIGAACRRIGNTTRIAAKRSTPRVPKGSLPFCEKEVISPLARNRYLQPRDADFARAATEPWRSAQGEPFNGDATSHRQKESRHPAMPRRAN